MRTHLGLSLKIVLLSFLCLNLFLEFSVKLLKQDDYKTVISNIMQDIENIKHCK